MSFIRRNTHAGTWYTEQGPKLNAELTSWLANVDSTKFQSDLGGGFNPPIKGCKAIIVPHAGYSYSGPAAAWAYRSIDTTGIKRVFILGPSHHVYLDGCAVSQCSTYQTPIGDLPLDRQTTDEIHGTGEFTQMRLESDEDEHSIEMHLPYVRKVFEGQDIQIVPILVGSLTPANEKRYGAILAPYLARDDTFTVISSDFCHWGSRFSYTFYYPARPPLPESIQPLHLSTKVAPSPGRPIHESITELDREAMNILELSGDGEHPSAATSTHDEFARYLARTRNTICGRHPIGVMLGALGSLESQGKITAPLVLKWVRYEQSSQCATVQDSSVSYASAYITF
ncbi:hypothetical protein FRB94_007131 [Tulasnella sp. JGI-2019a]|nr:hypothetical protein FRB93_012449 [Tulasnella sp. JGI-2019a]KAG9011938.1 hypothetical protein FRB94_007131 [Tulasnella sp. JGI-2019a]KAG9036290.1 hypothetical protein FRB95_009438 [Tulasnella sp. JGI-2019a]